MTIAETVAAFLDRARIAQGRVVVGVSGGADSTALLIALHELTGYDVIAAHVNHHLRGAESDADEQFVRDLCARLGIELHVANGTLDDAAVRARGIEAAARAIRYAQLSAVRVATGAQWIATAHQKDDQAETVLMRLLTGSGIAGLRGIHPVREDAILRPLLDVTRTEINAFLSARGVTPRHDRSNDDPRFLRNRVRLLVRDVGAIGPLAAIADQARSLWPIVERAIDEADRTHCESSDDDVRFRSLPDDVWMRGALLQRHIRRLDPHARDFDAERIARELDAVKRLTVTRTLELVRDGDALLLRRLVPTEPCAFEIDLVPGQASFLPEIGRTIHVVAAGTSAPHPGIDPTVQRQRFQLPAGSDPHFVVRSRRPGDRIQPLGMEHSKKVKDLLIDRKIAASGRDRIPLLVWNGEIVWVAGVEVSEKFKLSSRAAGDVYEVWIE